MKCIITCINITSRMSRPEFFEPKPVVSPKKNINSGFFVESKPIRRKLVLRRRPGYYFPPVSVLGKRKAESAFGQGMNDKERYGQEIPPDFFKTNVGHNALPERLVTSSLQDNSVNSNNLYETKINYWREKYLTKR